MQARKIERIVTHEKPHLDEICAIWLLRRFGEKMFPGINEAKISFTSTGGQLPEDVSAEDLEKGGILPIGTCGGRLDEHPSFDAKSKENECASTLVAKHLGIDDNPALEGILQFVLQGDTKKGTGHPFDLAKITNSLHRQHPERPGDVIRWTTVGIEAKYCDQLKFLSKTKKEFEQKAEVENITGPGGRTLKMVTIVTDNEQMNGFARSKHGGEASIVIQKGFSGRMEGNVQIFTNARHKLTLHDIVQMLRIAEQGKKGKTVTTDWKELAEEGRVAGAEEWWFFSKGGMILNGSLTAQDVMPTKIPLEEIQMMVRLGVNPNAFEPKRAPNCKQGKCSSSRDNQCPWYKWGLHRCRKIRFEMNKCGKGTPA